MRRITWALVLWLAWQPMGWAGSLSFDGSNDKVTITDTSISDSFTIAIWAQLGGTTGRGNDCLLCRGAASGQHNYYLNVKGSSDAWQFGFYDTTGGTWREITSTTNYDTSWHFLAGVWDTAADTSTLYLDGVIIAGPTTFTNATPATGGTQSTCVAALNNCAGEFNLIEATWPHIYSRALTAVEINEIMRRPCGIPDSLSACFSLFGVDTTEIDLSGNGKTGTVAGAVFSSDGPPGVMLGGLQ